MSIECGREAGGASVFMKFVLRSTVLIFLSITIVSALAPQAAQAQSYQFSAIQVEGNQRIEAASVIAFTGIARGQTLSAAQLNEAYQKVLQTGLFETVDFVPQGGQLLIRVAEWPTINRISVEGNRRIDDEKALALISSQPRRVLNPSQIEQDAAALTEAYRTEGRMAATVTPRLIRQSENRVDVVFEVTEGRVVEVERLSFVGNRDFSDRRLRRVLDTKQAGLLAPHYPA